MPPQTITIPYNYRVKAHVIPFLASKKRFKIAVMHRRAGKTRMALNHQIMKAVQKKGIYYFILPTYAQAKVVVFDELLKDHLPQQIVEKKNDSELAVYYKNGSIQRFVGSEDADKHRGINPIDAHFDEFSESNPKMWYEVIQPVLRENGGTASFTFTPKGRNHSWKLLQEARDNRKEWFTTVLPYTETGIFALDEIEQAKKSIPEAIFNQEFACEFLDSATAFFKNVEACIKGTPLPPISSQAFKMGVDLAKYQDFTVITVFDQDNFVVFPQERFNQIDWNMQKAKIEAMYYRFGMPPVCIDATGVGDPVVEDLERRGVNVEPFKFSERSRNELLTNLALLIEQGKIILPDDPELIEELHGFQYQLNKNGKVELRSVLAHDDRVMSLALAVWQAPDEPIARTRRAHDSLYIGEREAREHDPYADFAGV